MDFTISKMALILKKPTYGTQLKCVTYISKQSRIGLRNHHRVSSLGCLRPRTVLSLPEGWVENPAWGQGSDCLRTETNPDQLLGDGSYSNTPSWWKL